ncbi:MAG: hypothetical protein KAS71_00500 [Bacteroidales bacterium]|nr:hypothetical protein [Bacteroidales bacterium]
METRGTEITVKEWIKRLQSEDDILVKKTITELRDKGSNELIPELGNLLKNKATEEISTSVISFFRDLKLQDSVPAFVQVLKESKELPEFSSLVSAAWENGLDYSEHLEFFINLILDEDFIIAMESFTVVEENVENLNQQKRIQFSKYITKRMKFVSEDKASLVKELLSIVDIAPGPFSLDESE